jgi:hypothetical protein
MIESVASEPGGGTPKSEGSTGAGDRNPAK